MFYQNLGKFTDLIMRTFSYPKKTNISDHAVDFYWGIMQCNRTFLQSFKTPVFTVNFWKPVLVRHLSSCVRATSSLVLGSPRL